ncbi:serine hydrolase [Porphyrobacter sp. HT-58-2]|uniref:serine hydrolase n=1 Tax=Porphyrobacter sp. HT-58-2 TaxID=2023229 RepID=UPI001558B7E2|nr:serine hydrolase [Porphyrobacter sp. HT-58-2]
MRFRCWPHAKAPRAALEIRFERGLAKGGIAISPSEDNRINELRFTSIDAVAVEGDTAEKIVADLAALPGTVNARFGPLDGGAPVISINGDKPLALGSTFKLYVLAALAEDVKAGRRKWSDVVRLTEKSYPSGQMQDWPEGSAVTLHTLASLMISISDNTATDQLIAVLGRQRILKLMKDSGHSDPAANDPFLNTRELFVLKTWDREALDEWRKGSSADNVALDALLASANPSLDEVNAAFAQGPKAIDIEWFASPADLAGLFAHMRRKADPEAFRIMAINPSTSGDAVRSRWDYIGFKGGSEPGVLNYTWLLTDKAGRDLVLTLGWNNPAAVVDEGRLNAIAQRILLLPH